MKKSKVETIEEFLARGGKITILPQTEAHPENQVIKVNTQFTHHQLSLADGEFYFGESRLKPKTKKPNKDFNSALESSGLPKDILDSIRKSISEKNNND